MKETIIREAERKDFLWFKKVHYHWWLYHQKNLDWRYQIVDNYSVSEEEYLKLLDKYIILVVEKASQIIAIVLLDIIHEPSTGLFKERNYLYVSNLVVLEEYRKLWIWKILMNEVERIAKEKKISQIQLDVRSFNVSAIAFYRKWWYETTSENMIKHL